VVGDKSRDVHEVIWKVCVRGESLPVRRFA